MGNPGKQRGRGNRGFTAWSQLASFFEARSASMPDGPATEVLCAGGLEFRPSDFLVIAESRVLIVPRREQEVLAVLMRNQGRIVSREELYGLVWGKKFMSGERTVDVYVRKLRVRFERALPGWSFIHTHPGFGYRFAPEPSNDANGSVTAS